MQRDRVLFNDGWQFYSVSNLEGEWGSDIVPETLNLPHCWNAEAAVDPDADGYGQPYGIYAKTFDLPESWGARRVFIAFEGVSGVAQVYLNEHYLGEHIGGYTGFSFEITGFAQEKSNRLTVKVNNEANPDIIPSRISDFFVYSGITRNVWLYSVGSGHITDVRVWCEEVQKASARLVLEAVVDSPEGLAGCHVQVQVTDPYGELACTGFCIPGTDGKIRQELTISQPLLWTPANPALYRVEVQLVTDGAQSDRVWLNSGIRTFEFRTEEAFYLNGERLLLRGTHIHEDAPLKGSALTDEEHLRAMELIKSAGFNFVRLGHYPQSPAVLRACDALGLLVWCELPWCRGGVGGERFRTLTKAMLHEMIAQYFNHPAIIIWGLGNEFVEDIANPDHLLTNEVNTEVLSLVQELHDLAHTLDSHRVTAIRKYEPAAGIVDVYSPTIWAGWYRTEPFTAYGDLLQGYRHKYKSLFHMEYGGACLRGRYSEDWQERIVGRGVDGDFNCNYVNELFEWHILTLEETPWITGAAQWAFKDFATPLRPENDIPYVNMKGLVDRSGRPKDPYYIYKSYWGTEPVLYIESHDWTHRWGRTDESKLVKVYSNCSEVELFLNGTSVGLRKRKMGKFPAAGLIWRVRFRPGENELVAVGFNDGERVLRDTHVLTYVIEPWGVPARVEMEYREVAREADMVTLEVSATLVDDVGQRCLDAAERVRFAHEGEGHLLQNMGTAEGSKLVGLACGQARIQLVLAAGEQAEITAEVEGQKIQKGLLWVSAEPVW